MGDWVTLADTPAAMIGRLNGSLARRGEDATLRRPPGTGPGPPVDVPIRIHLRGYDPSQLVGLVTQQDQQFIMSPTEIEAANWPGTAPATGDARVPRRNDVLLTNRGPLAIQACAGIYVAGVLVRIEGRARGA